MNLLDYISVLITEEQLKKRVCDLALQISEDYEEKHPVIVSILKGALYFSADLTREISVPLNIDFLSIGVYPEITKQTGIVRITKDIDINITGRHVLLVDDTIGTGLTLSYLYQHLENRKPSSLAICSLLDNPDTRLVNLPVKYTGFSIKDYNLVGYGIDYREEFRHLKYIAKINSAYF